MSNLRDFSSEAYDEISHAMDIDYTMFGECPNPMHDYYSSLAEKHSIDMDKLEEIFKNVAMCDNQFNLELSYSYAKLEKLKACVKKIADMFDCDENGYHIENTDSFSIYLSEIDTANADYTSVAENYCTTKEYYFKLFYYNGVLNTEAIAEVMNMEPSEVSEAQYAAFVMIIASLTKEDIYGDIIVDIEILEDFINCSYIEVSQLERFKMYGEDYTDQTFMYDDRLLYMLSPVFITMVYKFLGDVVIINTIIQLQENDITFSGLQIAADDLNSNQNQKKVAQQLISQMSILSIVLDICNNYIDVNYQDVNYQDTSTYTYPYYYKTKFINLDYVPQKSKKLFGFNDAYYTISGDRFNKTSKVFEYSSNLSRTAIDVSQEMLTSFERSKNELVYDTVDCTIDCLIDVVETLCQVDKIKDLVELAGKIKSIYDKASDVYGLYQLDNEIYSDNTKINCINKLLELSKSSNLINIYGSLTMVIDDSPSFAYPSILFIDEKKLQDELDNYYNQYYSYIDKNKRLTSREITLFLFGDGSLSKDKYDKLHDFLRIKQISDE